MELKNLNHILLKKILKFITIYICNNGIIEIQRVCALFDFSGVTINIMIKIIC